MEAEAQRLARIQKRQQRELAQLIAAELKLAEARKVADLKDEEDDGRVRRAARTRAGGNATAQTAPPSHPTHIQFARTQAADLEARLAEKRKAAAEEARMRELKRQLADAEEMARNVSRRARGAPALDCARSPQNRAPAPFPPHRSARWRRQCRRRRTCCAPRRRRRARRSSARRLKRSSSGRTGRSRTSASRPRRRPCVRAAVARARAQGLGADPQTLSSTPLPRRRSKP